MSSPVLQIFGFCFIFFILYHFAPKAREYIFDFYAVIFVCLCFSPLSLASLDSSPARGRAKTKPIGYCPPTRAGEVPPQAAERAKSWPQRSDKAKQKSARFRALARLYNFCEKECFSPPVSSASARPVPGKGGTAAPRRCPDRRRQGAPRSGGCCRGACNSRSRRRR